MGPPTELPPLGSSPLTRFPCFSFFSICCYSSRYLFVINPLFSMQTLPFYYFNFFLRSAVYFNSQSPISDLFIYLKDLMNAGNQLYARLISGQVYLPCVKGERNVQFMQLEREDIFEGLSLKVHQSIHMFAPLSPLPSGSCLLSDSFFSTLLVIWAFLPMASFIVGPFKSPLKIYLEQKEMTGSLRCARTSRKTQHGNIEDCKTLVIVPLCHCVWEKLSRNNLWSC